MAAFFGQQSSYTNAGDDGQGAATSSQTVNQNTILQQQLSIGAGGFLTPTTILIGLIGLLVVMKLVGESDKLAPGIQPAHLSIGGYNILAVTVTSIVGIVLLKVVFNKFQVPGITDLINAA